MSAGDLRPVDEDDLLRLVDGRLDPERQAIVEQWLAEHPEEEARVAADRAIRDQLRRRLAPIAEEPIPERLRLASLAPRRPAVRWWPRIAAALFLLAVGAAAGWFGRAVVHDPAPPPTASAATREAVAAFRTFVPEVVHPVEVRADQKPHLVQWLSKRVGEPVTVPDLSGQGFQLIGGRIVPTNDTPAALLMYEDKQGARLTLYCRVGAVDGGTRFRYAQDGDIAAFSWTEGDGSYVVAARMDEARLLFMAEVIDAQLRAGASIKP